MVKWKKKNNNNSDLGYKLRMHKHEVISKVMKLILIW